MRYSCVNLKYQTCLKRNTHLPAREREIGDQKISLAFSPPVPNIWALLKNTQRKEVTCQGKKRADEQIGEIH